MRNSGFVIAVLVASCGFASQAIAQSSKELLAMSEVGMQNGLPYRLFKPPVAAGTKYPLVVYLHGAGQRGTDHRRPLVHVRGEEQPLAAWDPGAGGPQSGRKEPGVPERNVDAGASGVGHGTDAIGGRAGWRLTCGVERMVM